MDKHPKDYVVPNFGNDRDDVLTTANSLKVAEAQAAKAKGKGGKKALV